MVKITKTKFINAVNGSGGIITAIGKRLGASRIAVHAYIKKPGNEWTREYLDQEKEKFIDLAEAGLLANVRKKDMGAIKYTLSTLGKKRGYVEKSEIESTSKVTVNMKDLVSNTEEGDGL